MLSLLLLPKALMSTLRLLAVPRRHRQTLWRTPPPCPGKQWAASTRRPTSPWFRRTLEVSEGGWSLAQLHALLIRPGRSALHRASTPPTHTHAAGSSPPVSVGGVTAFASRRRRRLSTQGVYVQTAVAYGAADGVEAQQFAQGLANATWLSAAYPGASAVNVTVGGQPAPPLPPSLAPPR